MRGAGTVTVVHVRTEDNAADIFTKILPRQTFEKHHRTILNLSDPTPEVPAAAMGIIRHTEVAGSQLAAGGVARQGLVPARQYCSCGTRCRLVPRSCEDPG